MKEEKHRRLRRLRDRLCRLRDRLLFRQIRRDVEAWFCCCVSALKTLDKCVARFLKKIWSGFRSISVLVSVFLLLPLGVLGVLKLWGLKAPDDGSYYLRASLITAGVAAVAGVFFSSGVTGLPIDSWRMPRNNWRMPRSRCRRSGIKKA